MRRSIPLCVLLLLLTGVPADAEAPPALNAYLTIMDTKVELDATAWGRVDRMRPGQHIDSRPPRGTNVLSVLPDETTFPVLQELDGKGNDIFGDGSTYILLTLIDDTRGSERVLRFMGISDFACNARSRTCGFVFANITWT